MSAASRIPGGARALGAPGLGTIARDARSLGAVASLAIVGMLASGAARAQLPAAAGESRAGEGREVRGRVVIPHDTAMTGVPDTWVTLHRVGPDGGAPLDSMRTDAAGRFTFRYHPRGDSAAIYFVSAMRGGIAYFSSPLRDALVTGEAGEVTVFDTTSGAVALTVRGRHVILARPGAAGMREVIEVYELSNDGALTAIPRAGDARGVWSAPLPRTARGFAVRPSGELTPDAMSAANGRAALFAPVGPGLKQIQFSYRVPGDAFPLAIDLSKPPTVLEVLVEEPNGSASGAGLVQASPVSVEGHTFRRFLAQDPKPGTIELRAGGDPAGAPRAALPIVLGVVGGAMVVTLLGTAWRRRPIVAPAPALSAAAAAPDRDRLLAELAALDDAHARGAADEADYDTRRAVLAAALRRELVGEPVAGPVAASAGRD